MHFFSLFLEKLLKTAYFERFHPKMWHICGTYVASSLCTKIDIFLEKLRKIARTRLFWAIWAQNVAHMWHIVGDVPAEQAAQKLTFFCIFSRKSLKTGVFEHFSSILWHIYGQFGHITCAIWPNVQKDFEYFRHL